ncbi:MAG: diphosphomevalonate decarboxylase [Polyangiaceae bacterium]|nr:diphosphomevalonate decarboxylase [Polyangiaceae bacterium]
MQPARATAVAHPNIALAKYWGKLEGGHNLPAVPSLSVTLAGMATRTTVEVAPGLAADELVLGGKAAAEGERARASRLCDLVWPGGLEAAASGAGAADPAAARPRVRILSHNDFPTAAGLASSASAFAALAVAADAALGAGRARAELSDIARRVSASAGRSLYGGFVELPAAREGEPSARVLPAVEVAPADHWALAVVVGVTTEARKEVGSTEGMLHTARTSPYYPAWVASAPAVCRRVRAAVLARDIAALGEACEESALAMHAAAIAARPGIVYWNGATVDLMAAVRGLRREGLAAYFTIDAGPHVKVVCEQASVATVETRLASVPGCLRTIAARPGPGARVEP